MAPGKVWFALTRKSTLHSSTELFPIPGSAHPVHIMRRGWCGGWKEIVSLTQRTRRRRRSRQEHFERGQAYSFAFPGGAAPSFAFTGRRIAFPGRLIAFPGRRFAFPGRRFAFPGRCFTIPGEAAGLSTGGRRPPPPPGRRTSCDILNDTCSAQCVHRVCE